jgi:hypothetical protein
MTRAIAFALTAALAGCMMPDETAPDASVPPPPTGGGGGGPPPPPPPPPDLDGGLGWGPDGGPPATGFPGSGLHGDFGTGVLVMLRIDRGTANLADAIELLVKQFADRLDAAGLKTSSVAVADLYRGNLVWGTRLNTNPRRPLAEALRLQAAQVDTTVRLSGCTTEGLRSIGSRIGNVFTEDGIAPFYPEPGALAVLMIDTDARPQPLSACPGASTFATNPASWLYFYGPPMARPRIRFALAGTSESLSANAMRAQCLQIGGFPTSALDAVAPSSVPFFDPLTDQLNAVQAGFATRTDLCALLGNDGSKTLDDFAKRWVQVLVHL